MLRRLAKISYWNSIIWIRSSHFIAIKLYNFAVLRIIRNNLMKPHNFTVLKIIRNKLMKLLIFAWIDETAKFLQFEEILETTFTVWKYMQPQTSRQTIRRRTTTIIRRRATTTLIIFTITIITRKRSFPKFYKVLVTCLKNISTKICALEYL